MKLTPANFDTERLRVWTVRIKPTEQHEPRLHLFACRIDTDCPMVVASMTLWMQAGSLIGGPKGSHYVEMIEVNDIHRREGLAKELWLAVEKQYGPLIGTGTTTEGEALMDSLAKPTPHPPEPA